MNKIFFLLLLTLIPFTFAVQFNIDTENDFFNYTQSSNNLTYSNGLLQVSVPGKNVVWVSEDLQDQIKKVNALDGSVLAVYKMPSGSSPSRTVVDYQGNVWVGLRGKSPSS